VLAKGGREATELDERSSGNCRGRVDGLLSSDENAVTFVEVRSVVQAEESNRPMLFSTTIDYSWAGLGHSARDPVALILRAGFEDVVVSELPISASVEDVTSVDIVLLIISLADAGHCLLNAFRIRFG